MAKKKSSSGKQGKSNDELAPPPVLEAQVVEDGDDDKNEDRGRDETEGGDDEGEEEEEEELELLQVDLGDMVKMKQVLDEAVSAALLENPTENSAGIGVQLSEDTSFDNMKLCIMAVACTFAMVAQFAPIPFPDSRPVLGMCMALYFVLSGVLQYITTFIDQDAILMTLPKKPNTTTETTGATTTTTATKSAKSKESKKKDGKGTSPAASPPATNPLLSQYGLRVRSNLPRFSEFYTVILEFHGKSKSGVIKTPSGEENPTVRETWSVGQFFDKEGYFDEVGCMMQVCQLYQRLERQEYDDEATKKKKLE
jgi:signal peptidase complex subunit 2